MVDGTELSTPTQLLKKGGVKKFASKLQQGLGGALNGMLHSAISNLHPKLGNAMLSGALEAVIGMSAGGAIKDKLLSNVASGFGTVGASRAVEEIILELKGRSVAKQLQSAPTPQAVQAKSSNALNVLTSQYRNFQR